MTVFVCIDDRGGMIFNKRRLSKDKMIICDIEKEVMDEILYITDFSEALFADSNVSALSVPDPLSCAQEKDFVFIENLTLKSFIDKIDKLIIYKWNRKYPFDLSLDVDPAKDGFSLESSSSFKGNSHDKITKEIYVK